MGIEVGTKGTNENLGEASRAQNQPPVPAPHKWVCPHHQTQYSDREAGMQVCVHTKSLESCVQLFATLWTVAHQASLSMGFSRQEYWNGLSFPSPGDLPNPGIEPASPVAHALQKDSLLTTEPPGKP